MKKNIALGILVSSLFVYLALRNMNFGEVAEAFRSANYGYAIPVIGLVVVTQVLRSYRWGVILEPVKKVDPWLLFGITNVGFMAIDILPVRLGEFVRPYLVSRRSGIRLSSSMATIIVERVFDMLTLMGLFMWVLLFVSLPPWLKRSGFVILGVFLALFVVLVFMAVKRDFSLGKLEAILGKLPSRIAVPLKGLTHSFIEGLGILPNVRKTLLVAFLSFSIWLTFALTVYILFSSFESMSALPFVAGFAVIVTTALGVMLPTAPGFVGNFHFFCVLGLTFFGVSRAEALTFAILLHFFHFSIVIIMGLMFLPFQKVPLPEIFRVRQKGKASGNEGV